MSKIGDLEKRISILESIQDQQELRLARTFYNTPLIDFVKMSNSLSEDGKKVWLRFRSYLNHTI